MIAQVLAIAFALCVGAIVVRMWHRATFRAKTARLGRESVADVELVAIFRSAMQTPASDACVLSALKEIEGVFEVNRSVLRPFDTAACALGPAKGWEYGDKSTRYLQQIHEYGVEAGIIPCDTRELTLAEVVATYAFRLEKSSGTCRDRSGSQ